MRSKAHHPWSVGIDAAWNGDLQPLVDLLRSDVPIAADEERYVRHAIAAILAPKKRSKGRPRQTSARLSAKLNRLCIRLDIDRLRKALAAQGHPAPLKAACDQYAEDNQLCHGSGKTVLRYYRQAHAEHKRERAFFDEHWRERRADEITFDDDADEMPDDETGVD